MFSDQQFIQFIQDATGAVFNDVQKEAVVHKKGPLLLLATPGAGKTTVVICHIAYLILAMGVKPDNILALTFSRAGAKEMEERFAKVFGPLVPGKVRFATIHSFAYRIVREYCRITKQEFELIEGRQGGTTSGNLPSLSKCAVLKHLYQQYNQAILAEDKLEELSHAICFIKNSLLNPSDMEKLKFSLKNVTHIYQAYEKFKREAVPGKVLLDFDDMLSIANEVLETRADIRQAYQKQYPFILSDESQDTSLIQHRIIEKIAQPRNNLFVVGDDDQSIFSFRAAQPDYLLRFKQIYPQARVLTLEQNYRSSQEIVRIANQFIQDNMKRYPKNMITQNPKGRQPKLLSFKSDVAQVKYLVRELQAKEDLSQVAVLYRNNLSAVILMDELSKRNVPFYMKDYRSFFSHWVVQDILNFMRFSFSDRNPMLLEKIYTRYDSYIGKKEIDYLKGADFSRSVFDNLADIPTMQEFRKRGFQTQKANFKRLNKMTPLQAIRFIRRELNYDKNVEKMCERLGYSMDNVREILAILEHIAQHLKTLQEFAERLKSMEEMMQASSVNKGKNAVTLSTFHSAKGLEFETVYMMDLVEGIIPNSESIKAAEKKNMESMEEERRLFYGA